MKSPSRAGALARTSSTGSDGRTTSSRRMFSSSIVWAVGGMSSVGSSARIAYWSRMWLSWPSRRRQLLVGQPEAGEVGDVLDVGARQGGHGPMIADEPATHRADGAARRSEPMTRADVDAASDALLVARTGATGGAASSSRSRIREMPPFVADADGAIVGTGIATSTARSAGSARSGWTRRGAAAASASG